MLDSAKCGLSIPDLDRRRLLQEPSSSERTSDFDSPDDDIRIREPNRVELLEGRHGGAFAGSVNRFYDCGYLVTDGGRPDLRG
jgi:hypothetical protein